MADPRLTEAHIQQTVKEFLEADGWRAIRTEHALERTKEGKIRRKVGEVGMPDMLFLRYCPEPWEWHRHGIGPGQPWNPGVQCQAEVLFVEFKRRRKKPTAHQLAWHEAERRKGALVLVVDDIDDFRNWYKTSGLGQGVIWRLKYGAV